MKGGLCLVPSLLWPDQEVHRDNIIFILHSDDYPFVLPRTNALRSYRNGTAEASINAAETNAIVHRNIIVRTAVAFVLRMTTTISSSSST